MGRRLRRLEGLGGFAASKDSPLRGLKDSPLTRLEGLAAQRFEGLGGFAASRDSPLTRLERTRRYAARTDSPLRGSKDSALRASKTRRCAPRKTRRCAPRKTRRCAPRKTRRLRRLEGLATPRLEGLAAHAARGTRRSRGSRDSPLTRLETTRRCAARKSSRGSNTSSTVNAAPRVGVVRSWPSAPRKTRRASPCDRTRIGKGLGRSGCRPHLVP
jgi:hypothetical protein